MCVKSTTLCTTQTQNKRTVSWCSWWEKTLPTTRSQWKRNGLHNTLQTFCYRFFKRFKNCMAVATFIAISSHLILLLVSMLTSTKFIWSILALRNSILIKMVSLFIGCDNVRNIGTPYEERKNTDFRGTITYASLNAHNKIDLSRRDDLWSFYFVLLDFLGEELPWRTCRFFFIYIKLLAFNFY